MKILITAFEPFGKDTTNSALESVNLLDENVDGIDVIKMEVPTVFGKSVDIVMEKVRQVCPDAVICVGQAGSRIEISPEMVAINWDDARIPDNEGNQPIGSKIYKDGENAYFTTLPVKAMVQEIKQVGIPSALSYSAGTFVCNHLMYGLLHNLKLEFPKIRGGFIHVPYTTEQVAKLERMHPSLSLFDIKRSLEACIRAVAKYDDDIVKSEGKES